MVKCILIDDKKRHRETLAILLKTYCPQVEIVGEAWDKKSLLQAIKNQRPDLIFFDINLGATTAFEILDKIDPIDFKIVFVTASESYAIEGYRYRAIDYLLKPIEPKQLIAVVEKVQRLQIEDFSKENILREFQKLSRTVKSSLKFSVSDNKGLHILKLDEILYCQSNGNYTTLILKNKPEITVSKNLKYFESKFEGHNFLRIHKSYLINVDHVDQVMREDEGMILMANQTSLPLSKTHKKKLVEMLNDL